MPAVPLWLLPAAALALAAAALAVRRVRRRRRRRHEQAERRRRLAELAAEVARARQDGRLAVGVAARLGSYLADLERENEEGSP